MIRSRRVKPRASRIALIAASVPEETSRTFSTDGHGVDDLGRELDLGLGRRAEGRAARGRGDDGLDRLGIGVPEDQRPPGHDPVEVAPAVDVLDVRARAAARRTTAPRARPRFIARTGELTPPGISFVAR